MSGDISSLSEKGIAIVGMAGRFPGAKNLQEYWTLLERGQSALTHFSDQQLLDAGVAHEMLRRKNYIKIRGILSDIDLFDPEFFGINPYDASMIDPQQRIFAELAWEAYEQSGYSIDSNNCVVGVYAGAQNSYYIKENLNRNSDFLSTANPYRAHVATSNHFLTTRISYLLNLKGPSINVNTACSTSLVAIAEACKALLREDCTIALAGGVSIYLPQISGYVYQEGGVHSPTGECRPFDKNANGIVRGSGAGVVVLKRLGQAIKDRDDIHAVIRGVGVNNDGADKMGFYAPSVTQQANCILSALNTSGIDPRTISYIETHGTGTLLGDAVEVAALTKAFRRYTDDNTFCAIGSVKSNIGHTDAASGVGGLLKSVLALKYGFIPPTIHFSDPNPEIDFAHTPFYVQSKGGRWMPENKVPRRAGVSSFGIGGTNAHIILEEAPKKYVSETERASHIILHSAKNEKSLAGQHAKFTQYCSQTHLTRSEWADVAFTLQTGRKSFKYRSARIASGPSDFVENKKRTMSTFEKLLDKRKKIAFVYPGQGVIYPGILSGLYKTEAISRAHVDACCHVIPQNLRQRVLEYLLGETLKLSDEEKYADLVQLMMFIVEYTLTKTLMDLGVRPNAVIGHSLGEYTAACISGVITLDDALKLLIFRGQLANRLAPGKMLAVPMSKDQFLGLIDDAQIDIAAVNAQESIVISGPVSAIESAQKRLDDVLNEKHLACIALNVPYAFHSSMVEPLLEEFESFLKDIEFKAPNIPFLSCVTGTWLKSCSAQHFVTHFRQTVLFHDAVKLLLSDQFNVFLEVGAGKALTALILQSAPLGEVLASHTLPKRSHYTPDEAMQPRQFLKLLAKCWVNHLPVNWCRYHENEQRGFKSLPTYAFTRERYWVSPSSSGGISKGIKYYLPKWIVLNSKASMTIPKEVVWLIFTDEHGVGDYLNQRLTDHQYKTIIVKKGVKFKHEKKYCFEMDVSSLEHYELLREFLESEGIRRLSVIHLLTLEPKFLNVKQKYEIDSSVLDKGFFSLVYLAQSILRHDFDIDSIEVVTNYSKKVLPKDDVIYEQTALYGPALVLSQEYDVTVHVTDIGAFDDYEVSQSCDMLFNSFFEKNRSKAVVQRKGMRFTEEFLPRNISPLHDRSIYIKKGVYLLLGGAGRIGYVLAEHLARECNAYIYIVSRSGDSARQQPFNALSDEASALEFFTADASRPKDMEDIIQSILMRHEKIDVAFHLAGNTQTLSQAKEVLKQITPENAMLHFKSKISPMKVLEHIAEAYPIDTCVLFSSISTLLGGLGFASYAASNFALDACAEQTRQKGAARFISVNWDAWQFKHYSGYLDSITPLEGISALDECYALTDASRVVVVKKDLEQRLQEWVDREDKTETHLELTHQNRNEVYHAVHQAFEVCLNISDFTDEDDFYELGGDSLLMVRLLNLLKKSFGDQVSLSDIIKFRTVSELTRFFSKSRAPADSAVVTLRESGDAPPLFLIHPLSGTVSCFFELVKYLPESHPCYAIQDPGIAARHSLFSSIEEMASYYIDLIRSIYPEGVFYLGGYSLGASVAIEMVRQLNEQGGRVPVIFNIEGWTTFSEAFRTSSRVDEVVENHVERTLALLPEGTTYPHELRKLMRERVELLFNYKPSMIEVHHVLFKAKELLIEYRNIDDCYNHWKKYAQQPIERYEITANHDNILAGGSAKCVGEIMAGIMEDSQYVTALNDALSARVR